MCTYIIVLIHYIIRVHIPILKYKKVHERKTDINTGAYLRIGTAVGTCLRKHFLYDDRFCKFFIL